MMTLKHELLIMNMVLFFTAGFLGESTIDSVIRNGYIRRLSVK